MFLKNLISIWKGSSLLREALSEFDEMMELADWMFDEARKVFKGESTPEAISEKFFATDKKINDMEKNIRRKIIELLTVNPSADVPACLVLMSVVKDAERIGDYAKNIFELVTIYGKPIKDGEVLEGIIEIQDKIEVICSRTRKAFHRSDSELARESIETARRVSRLCDDNVKALFDSSIGTREALTFVLKYRFLKRIVAHLANICTTILRPLPEIDYFD
jgi:phosphate uptake regulator